MLRQLQAAFLQQLRPEDHGVHQDIVPLHETVAVVPAHHPALRQDMAVVHDLLALLALLLVDEIADQHIQGRGPPCHLPQGVQHLQVGLLLHPVVAVHHLEVKAGGVLDTRVDGSAMAPVLLVDSLNDGGVSALVLVRNLRGPVLHGTVVHDDDLHVLSAHQQRIHTFPHVVFRIIAWNRYR